MNRELTRIFGFALVAIALTLVVAVLVESIFKRGGGPEGAIVTRLKGFESDGLKLATADGGLLWAAKPGFQRISIQLDANGEGAEVTSTLDFTGTLDRGQKTKVSSLGLERARYELKRGDWVPVTNDAPRLMAIVSALEQRRDELERGAPLGDGGIPFPDVKLPRQYRAESWFIRSERETVEIAEDSRLIGTAPDRPVDEKRTTRLSLEEDGGLFRFPGGVM
ncbi:MAG: hypothetical protein QM817_16505 [Archangium sp.]